MVAAPLGDLQVGQVIRGGQQPLSTFVGMVDVPVKFRRPVGHDFLNGLDDVGVVARAQNAVHFGQGFLDLLPIALGKTAGD